MAYFWDYMADPEYWINQTQEMDDRLAKRDKADADWTAQMVANNGQGWVDDQRRRGTLDVPSMRQSGHTVFEGPFPAAPGPSGNQIGGGASFAQPGPGKADIAMEYYKNSYDPSGKLTNVKDEGPSQFTQMKSPFSLRKYADTNPLVQMEISPATQMTTSQPTVRGGSEPPEDSFKPMWQRVEAELPQPYRGPQAKDMFNSMYEKLLYLWNLMPNRPTGPAGSNWNNPYIRMR